MNDAQGGLSSGIRVFAIGDPHLSFSEEKPMDIFGPEWADHDRRLAAEWKNLVSPSDYVLVVGDLSWALKSEDAQPDLDWIAALPGQKVIVKGNHDLWWQGITKLNAMYANMHFIQNDHVMIGDVAICGSRGWLLPGEDGFGANDEKILSRELIRLQLSLDSAMAAGAKSILCAIHFPPAISPKNSSVFTELLDRYPVTQVVYGHLHGSGSYQKGIAGIHGKISYRLVSLDYLACKPLLIATV
jgi:predicted phosphohydrolase